MARNVCEFPNCNGEVFAACSCTNCSGNGPLLCHEHFVNGPCPLTQQSEVIEAEVLVEPIPQNSITNAVAVSDGLPTKQAFMAAVMPAAKKPNSFLLTVEEKAAIIAELQRLPLMKKGKTRAQYRLLERYCLADKENGGSLLLERLKETDKQEETDKREPRQFLNLDETYEELTKAHRDTLHGGTNMMWEALRTK